VASFDRMATTTRQGGWLPVLIVLVLVLAGMTIATRAIDRSRARWAFGIDGRAPLADSWVGRLTTATGKRRAMLLELRLRESTVETGQNVSRQSRHGRIAGTMRACDEGGAVREYVIDGTAEDRDAARFAIHARPVEEIQPDGLTFSWLHGRWDGADRLELATSFFWRQGASAITGFSYPDTETQPTASMTRGGAEAFRALCAAIRGR